MDFGLLICKEQAVVDLSDVVMVWRFAELTWCFAVTASFALPPAWKMRVISWQRCGVPGWCELIPLPRSAYTQQARRDPLAHADLGARARSQPPDTLGDSIGFEMPLKQRQKYDLLTAAFRAAGSTLEPWALPTGVCQEPG